MRESGVVPDLVLAEKIKVVAGTLGDFYAGVAIGQVDGGYVGIEKVCFNALYAW